MPNIDELQKHADAKDYILPDSIYMKCPETEAYRDGKQVNGCPGLGVGVENDCPKPEVIFGVMKCFNSGLWRWLHNSINLSIIINNYLITIIK